MKLFSGSANHPLSQEIASLLGLAISPAEVIRFANSEVRVRIKTNVTDKTCAVIQPTANPTDTNLMELFLFCDALRREGAKKIIGIIPYFGYARQDVQHRQGESVSATVVVHFLEAVGFYKIYTIDIHDEATGGVFAIPFKNLSAMALLAEKVGQYLGRIDRRKIAIASPDQGGIKRAREFGYYLFGDSNFNLTVIEKKRDLSKLHESNVLQIYGQVAKKTVVLVDDIATSANTLINASRQCLKEGAHEVLAAITHHDFSPEAPQKIEKSPIKKLFTTNTIKLKDNQRIAKLVEVSVAPLISSLSFLQSTSLKSYNRRIRDSRR